MSAPLAVVGTIDGSPLRGTFTLVLDDGTRVACEVDPALFGLQLPDSGHRLAMLAEVLERGSPHPERVRARKVVTCTPGAQSDNLLLAQLGGVEVARRGDLPPAPERPTAEPAKPSAIDPRARPPYYRFGVGMAVLGGFSLGTGLARWDDLAARPVGWSIIAIVMGLCCVILASAIAAGRAPFEVARGRSGPTGRPAWDVSGFIFFVGAFALMYVPMAWFGELAVATAGPAALAVGVIGAGLTVFIVVKVRASLAFGHRAFWGTPRLTGVVDGDGAELRVSYVNKSRSYTVNETDKNGNTRSVEKTTSWVEASANVVGADALRLRRADGCTEEVRLSGTHWSAPVRYAVPGPRDAAWTISRISPGDRVVVVAGKPERVFGAPGDPRRALVMIIAAYALRLGTLVAATGAALFLAHRWW